MRRILTLVLAITLFMASIAGPVLADRHSHSSHSSRSSHKSASSKSSKSEEKRLRDESKRQEKENKQRIKAQQKAFKEQEKLARKSSKDYYINVNGHKIHRPMYSDHFPENASGECNDGTFTFSEHKKGSCSNHGGVRSWVRN